MTVRETAYQSFAFGKVTFDHREALTATESKVLDYYKAGHSEEHSCRMLQLQPSMFQQHLRQITAKGWI